ncbi:M9 family metallopeptidase [Shewanella kaireitica]|uniref:M9 family metallopeptidase n=1 Tax=Shewanella kaireitica TaxID=212021 RepID=UPI00200D5879|nr:M9 family metallopeptidase [Shewanella kaireitica]MCL1093818.1 M9 family metallopeptidase [Shewanella kaireitica]
MKPNHLVVALGLFSASSLALPVSAMESEIATPLSKISSQATLTQPMGAMGAVGPVGTEGCESFIGLSGWGLVDKLASSDPQCVSPLYNLRGSDATALFSESNIRTALAGVRDRALRYTGVDTDGIESLIYYIRAALYVQFYSPDDVPTYSSGVESDTKVALNNLFNNSAAWTASDENAGVLKEGLILVDSSGLGAEFNWTTKKVLAEYDSSWEASWGMNAAANAIFTTLFRGQWDDDLKALFTSDSSIMDDLYSFQSRNRHLLGTDAQYVLVNAVREMSRFYYVDAQFAKTTSLVKSVLASTSKNDSTDVLWLAAAEMADYYDRANCNVYDICGFKYELEQDTLPFNYKCSTSLKLRAQSMYNDQAAWACGVLGGQETYFHSKLNTGNQPVANDNNSDLELVVFDSSNDYQSYAGTFFGIATNNGGMYLEGSPAGLKNQARFIAYEAEWRQPDFHVWNLQHEYVHYLDGRFNLYGDFSRSISANTIWWIEGLAEYISYRDANSRAIEMGETQEFSLSTIFKNDYDSGQDRIYRWGYLAVRFMFENHHDDVSQILALLRDNKYEEYQALMDSIGTSYDNEWRGWLTSGLSSSNDGIVDKGPADLDAQASGTNGNWAGTPSTISSDFSVCEPTDEASRHDPNSSSMTLDTPIECVDSKLGRASFSFANKDNGTGSIWIRTRGGWGDADIYYNSGGWASGELNEGFGIGNGNYEVIEVQLNPEEYWHYITLSGDFGGVEFIASTTKITVETDPGTPDPVDPVDPVDPIDPVVPHCGTATTNYGQINYGQSECLSGGRNSFYVYVEEDNTPLTISLAGGDGNADLYYNADTWAGTDSAQASSVTAANNESITVVAHRGWRYFTVDTSTEFSGVTLTVVNDASTTPVDPVTPVVQIVDQCAISGVVSRAEIVDGEPLCTGDGRNDYHIYVEQGAQSLSIRSGHGSGNLSIYAGTSWSNAASYDYASTNADTNQESITVSNPPVGWYYITVQSEPSANGATIQVDIE